MGFQEIQGELRAKKIITGAYDNDRIPHAYIFAGQDVNALDNFAKETAKLLICGPSCGGCPECKKIDNSMHQDYFKVSGTGKSGKISIDQIRELSDLVKYGPSASKRLVAVISEADQMTIEASNSFLKTLEEPPANVLFILTTSNEDAMARTVISRCQKIIFSGAPEAARFEFDLFQDREIPSLLAFSKTLHKSYDDIEGVLYALSEKYWGEKLVRETKTVLETIRDIKKRANSRLALDRMALKLGGVLN
jgi:DNA polymerase III delta prime subunit